MKVAVTSRVMGAHQSIRQLLSPWKVTFTSLDEADVSIVYGEGSHANPKTIVIPSDSLDFMEWLEHERSSVKVNPGTETVVSVTPQTTLSIIPQIQYYYDGLIEPISSIAEGLIKLNADTLLLTVDILKEYGRIMGEALNPKVSTLYRLLTGLPIHYTMAPKQMRNFLMRRNIHKTSLDLYDKLPLDALRFFLVKAIEEIADKELERKKWNGKRYACTMTHDIDTRDGLKRAKVVKRLEEKYDVPSAWYIPTKHYKLDPEIIRGLANYGEIGAHDTRQDGKLARLPIQKVVKRLFEAKQALESILDCPVMGFRAPLLQCNAKIIHSLEETGYVYDTSIPAWEPKHPQTMKTHGIGTATPMKMSKIVEIPITLPQDDQMLHVLGITPKRTVEAWIDLMGMVKDIGGVCNILMHPDYELVSPDGLNAYEELLSAIAISDAWVTTPKELITHVA